jgi:hypothetical protein
MKLNLRYLSSGKNTRFDQSSPEQSDHLTLLNSKFLQSYLRKNPLKKEALKL